MRHASRRAAESADPASRSESTSWRRARTNIPHAITAPMAITLTSRPTQ
jgi:hypothetical protein